MKHLPGNFDEQLQATQVRSQRIATICRGLMHLAIAAAALAFAAAML